MSTESLIEVVTIANAALGSNTKIQLFQQDNFFPILQNATVMEVAISPTQELMDQPIEKGATITDFTIKKPKVAEVSFILAAVSYLSDYLLIKQLYENNTFLVLQTTVDTYSNMIIAAMPYKESAEMYQALRIGITLREIQQVSPSYSPAPASGTKKAQIKNTTNKGNVQPKAATEQKESALASWTGLSG